MRRSRNRRTVGLLLALVLMIVCSGCAGSSGADENSSCPTQEEVDQAIANAEDLREEADGLDGGQGRQAREDASDAEAEAASLQTAFDSDECVAERNPTTTTAEDATTTTTEVEEEEDPASGLPIVEGGDPAAPTPGSETDEDPRTPMVRDGDIVTGWRGLDRLLGDDSTYINCVNETVPDFNWGRDVDPMKRAEREGEDTRFILAVNTQTNLSDDAIRQIASEDVGEDVSHLQILRVEQIVNTRGFEDGGCEQFIDRRSMVRVSLGRVIFNWDWTIQGLADDGGVFVGCHNPWRLTVPTPPAPGSPDSPDNPDNPPPPSGGGKNHTLSPVTDNPNDPCEACRPNTPEPPRDTPPPPAPQPTVPTPTTVAPPPPPPPTTTPPRPPGQGCVDPDGIGICQA